MIDTLYQVDSFYIASVEIDELRASSDSLRNALTQLHTHAEIGRYAVESLNDQVDRISDIYTIILAIIGIVAALFVAAAYFNIYKPLLEKEQKIDGLLKESESLKNDLILEKSKVAKLLEDTDSQITNLVKEKNSEIRAAKLQVVLIKIHDNRINPSESASLLAEYKVLDFEPLELTIILDYLKVAQLPNDAPKDSINLTGALIVICDRLVADEENAFRLLRILQNHYRTEPKFHPAFSHHFSQRFTELTARFYNKCSSQQKLDVFTLKAKGTTIRSQFDSFFRHLYKESRFHCASFLNDRELIDRIVGAGLRFDLVTTPESHESYITSLVQFEFQGTYFYKDAFDRAKN
ncbi:MAG: hypothetical protein AB8F78_07000 [Saprospiraceae bacterium]